MSILLEEIEKQVQLLPLSDRAALARRIIGDLEPAVRSELEMMWIAESERRYAAFERDELEARPGDEVMARVRQHIK